MNSRLDFFVCQSRSNSIIKPGQTLMITFHAFSRFLDTSRWKTLFTKSGQHLPAISMHLLLEVVVACGLILAIAVPRLLALDSFVTTDERLWLERSGKFYYALAQHDFAATFQKSHPGVTVMWAGLTGYMEVYPSYDENQGGQNRPIGLSTLQKRQFDLPLQILAAGRRT